MAKDIKKVILIAVALMVIGIIIPIAIGLIAGAGDVVIIANTSVNGSTTRLSDVADPSIVLMIEVLIPIIAVIAIVLLFLPTKKAS